MDSKMRLFQALSRTRPDLMQGLMQSAPIMDTKINQEFTACHESQFPRGNLKTMELFPTSQFQQNSSQKLNQIACSSSSPKECDKSLCEMTIFYNGCVTVMSVSRKKGDDIIKYANTLAVPKPKTEMKKVQNETVKETSEVKQTGRGSGLSIVRKASLQRFLQKREERLNSVGPFHFVKSHWTSKAYDRIQDQDLDLSLVSPCHGV